MLWRIPSVVRTWRAAGWPSLQDSVILFALLAACGALGAGIGALTGFPFAVGWPVGTAIGTLAGLVIGFDLFGRLFHKGALTIAKREGLLIRSQAKTSRLVVRPYSADDAHHLSATIDDEVMEANGWRPVDVRRWARSLRVEELRELSCLYTIASQDSGVLGYASFTLSPDRSLEVGFWLGPSARGHGLGTEVLTMLARIAGRHGHQQVRIETRQDNIGMRRSCERAGGTQLADTERTLPNGEIITSARYLLTATEHDAAPPFNVT